jgi:ferritin-like metal-binding protein YciE
LLFFGLRRACRSIQRAGGFQSSTAAGQDALRWKMRRVFERPQEPDFRLHVADEYCRARRSVGLTIKIGDAVMKTMEELFHALLQDVYYAEKQLTKALPKMAKEADDSELKKAFTDHLKETEGHVERLEQAFKIIGKPAKGKKCDAILGIIEEGKEVIEEVDDEQVLDAGLIASGQAAEHYEIARYGTLCAWAKLIGKPQIARLLHETLEEEKKADALLGKIADRSVNQHALSA